MDSTSNQYNSNNDVESNFKSDNEMNDEEKWLGFLESIEYIKKSFCL